VATSEDRGASWSQRIVAARGVAVDNVYPVLAASGARSLVVWSDASDGRLAAYGAWSADGGASLGVPKKLSRADETATLAWAAARGDAWWVAYATTDAPLADAGAA